MTYGNLRGLDIPMDYAMLMYGGKSFEEGTKVYFDVLHVHCTVKHPEVLVAEMRQYGYDLVLVSERSDQGTNSFASS